MLETPNKRVVPTAVIIDTIGSISREDLAWLAGFVDGEGCFYSGFNLAADREIPRRTLRTVVMVANTDFRPIKRAEQILLENQVPCCFTFVKGRGKWNSSVSLRVNGHGRCERFSRILLPFLTLKSEQARQMIFICEYRRRLAEQVGRSNGRVALIYNPVLLLMTQRMKELNAFRVSPTQKPSQTTRLAALCADDIVGATVEAVEDSRNVVPEDILISL